MGSDWDVLKRLVSHTGSRDELATLARLEAEHKEWKRRAEAAESTLKLVVDQREENAKNWHESVRAHGDMDRENQRLRADSERLGRVLARLVHVRTALDAGHLESVGIFLDHADMWVEPKP